MSSDTPSITERKSDAGMLYHIPLMPASDFLSVILGVSLLIPQVKKLKKLS